MKVPAKQDWGAYKEDLDVRYAYKLYGGRTIEEAMDDFINAPIERASELRFAPFKIFEYYVYCFIDYLLSEKSEEESDMASAFLRLLLDMSKNHLQEFSGFYPKIRNAVNQVAAKQVYYDADYDIYGSFEDIYHDIENNVKTHI